MNGTLTPKKIACNHIEKIVICPELEAASNEDIAAFEETFTPMDKYCGYGKYDFNSKADEDRACCYSHAHFLLNRYLTACVRHMLDAGIGLSEHSDFCIHIKETVEDKLDMVVAHETAAPATPADLANRLLHAQAANNTSLARQLNPENNEVA